MIYLQIFRRVALYATAAQQLDCPKTAPLHPCVLILPQVRLPLWCSGHVVKTNMNKCLVGLAGFGPATSASRTQRATKLRHNPSFAGAVRAGALPRRLSALPGRGLPCTLISPRGAWEIRTPDLLGANETRYRCAKAPDRVLCH